MSTVSSPVRSAPFEEQPGFYEPAKLWLYGNVRLLHQGLACVPGSQEQRHLLPSEFAAIEAEAEELVLGGKILVCGIHNTAHQRAAIVPLRWGAPRIVVFSGGFHFHLGEDLKQECFRAARLWRYMWDAKMDLAVSRRAPDKKPTFATFNPTVDRLVSAIAGGTHPGLNSPFHSLTPIP